MRQLRKWFYTNGIINNFYDLMFSTHDDKDSKSYKKSTYNLYPCYCISPDLRSYFGIALYEASYNLNIFINIFSEIGIVSYFTSVSSGCQMWISNRISLRSMPVVLSIKWWNTNDMVVLVNWLHWVGYDSGSISTWS